jgi:hypothetical protein
MLILGGFYILARLFGCHHTPQCPGSFACTVSGFQASTGRSFAFTAVMSRQASGQLTLLYLNQQPLPHRKKGMEMKRKKQAQSKPKVFSAISKRLKLKPTSIRRSTFGYND